jgi:predicted dithiol-disulfide oxidoreductase (DUF899 family)
VPVDEPYSFETSDGTKSLAELFDGRSQLLVYHLMFGPEDSAPCIGCSYTADNVDGAVFHLAHHDVTFVAVSRAPLDKLTAYHRRSGWSFPWVSALGTDFNLDFAVFTEEERRTGTGFNFGTARVAHLDLRGTELHGLSAFALDDGVVYRSYSAAPTCSTARGSSSTARRWDATRAPRAGPAGALMRSPPPRRRPARDRARQSAPGGRASHEPRSSGSTAARRSLARAERTRRAALPLPCPPWAGRPGSACVARRCAAGVVAGHGRRRATPETLAPLARSGRQPSRTNGCPKPWCLGPWLEKASGASRRRPQPMTSVPG